MESTIFEPYRRAASLLADQNLVWSADIESIKAPLSYCMLECATQENLHPYLLEIAYKLISDGHEVA